MNPWQGIARIDFCRRRGEMGVIMCPRCDKMVDLDYNVEECIEVGDEYICWTCATDEEQSEWEEQE